jgi:4-amino-4-deoxy-L-arabinose transferase-like glycosyltransferase
MTLPLKHRRLNSWLLSLAILGLALWLRLRNLYALPAFVDEGTYVLWAQHLSQGIVDYPALDGKFLIVLLVSWFQPATSPLWVARAAVGISSLITVAVCIGLGRRIVSPPTGALAGLFYAVLPFAVFHERQMLGDPLMIAAGAFSLFLSFQLASTPRRSLMVLLGAALAAAFLAKFFFGLEYLVFPFFALALNPGRQPRERLARYYAGAGLIAIALIATALFLFAARFGNLTPNDLFSIRRGFMICPPIVCAGDLAKQVAIAQVVLSTSLTIIPPYVGWPLAGLAALGLISWNKSEARRKGVLSLGAAAILSVYLLFTGGIAPGEIFLPPRYLLPLAVPLAIFAAAGLLALWRCWRMLNGFRRVVWQLSLGVIVALALGFPLVNTFSASSDPWRARYPPADIRQYFTENGDGAGFREAALAAVACLPGCTPPPAIIAEAQYNHFARAHIDRTTIDLIPDNEVTLSQIRDWLSARQSIFIIDQVESGAPIFQGTYQGLRAEEINRFGRPEGQQRARLLRVTGTSSELRHKIFDLTTINPDQITGDYQALLAAWSAHPPDLVLLYPLTQARALLPLVTASALNPEMAPVGDSWPLDVAAAEHELQARVASQPRVDVAFAQESQADPERRIETWLTTHLFHIDEQWFGPIRLVRFAGNGPVAQTIPVRTKFGESIQLDSIDILDSIASPGDIIRVRLVWHALAPTPAAYKVFTHLFSQETISAQHDSQPVGGLRPTHTWQPGEIIYDQFAIQLPLNTLPQTHQLRIGLYDPSSQARLSTSDDEGVSGEFVVGGRIEIVQK